MYSHLSSRVNSSYFVTFRDVSIDFRSRGHSIERVLERSRDRFTFPIEEGSNAVLQLGVCGVVSQHKRVVR